MNYYEILDLPYNVTTAELESAYKAKLDSYSPEKFKGHRRFANDQIKILKKAYTVLKSPTKKAKYDAELSQQKSVTEAQADLPDYIVSAVKEKQQRAEANTSWRGFYSDTNIKLMLAAAKSALAVANHHLENYPEIITRNFIGAPYLHTQQAVNLQKNTSSLLDLINSNTANDELIREEYLKFIKSVETLAEDKDPNPLAIDLRKKDIIDTLSQSISFTLFNKSTPRLTNPIKKSMDQYLNRVTKKLKVSKPKTPATPRKSR